MKIGYLGPPSTFSEEAAIRYFNGQDVEFVPFLTIVDVLDGVEEGAISKGIVPIENTLEGAINLSVDRLAESDDLFIEGEIVLPISLHLLGLDDTVLAEVKEVWSISPALTQCRQYTRKLRATTKNFDSTATAAYEVKRSGRVDVAAVGTALAAERLGMKILASDIQDTAQNHTRFLVVRKGQEISEVTNKSTLLVTPNYERRGVLANILHTLAELDINLTWIESRPTKTKLGAYHFFMDVDAGTSDDRLDKALTILDIYGHQVRVLGSYMPHAYSARA